MDFRDVDIDSLKWFPMSRKVIPVTQIRVQVPRAACTIEPGPCRYGIRLDRCHPAFGDFVRRVESHALEHASRFLGRQAPQAPVDLDAPDAADEDFQWPRSWFSSLGYGNSFKVNAFSDTTFFDREGKVCLDPTGFRGCLALLELNGAWVSDTHWGLRWKVLEVKDADVIPAAPPMPKAPTVTTAASGEECAFLDD